MYSMYLRCIYIFLINWSLSINSAIFFMHTLMKLCFVLSCTCPTNMHPSLFKIIIIKEEDLVMCIMILFCSVNSCIVFQCLLHHERLNLLILQRLSKSVTMVAKGVLKEHLILLGNNMTSAGSLIGFYTGGYKTLSRSLDIQVPFTEATLFVSLQFVSSL